MGHNGWGLINIAVLPQIIFDWGELYAPHII